MTNPPIDPPVTATASSVTGPEAEPVTIAIAYQSTYGHTARQAAAVAAGADSVGGARAELLDVAVLDERLWEKLQAAEAIVFGSPTYMGSTSAVFQAFAEASGKVWAERGWEGKLAAGFTNSAGVDGNKDNALLSMAVPAAQHGMTWVSPGWLYASDGTPDDLNRLGGFVGAMAQSPSDLGPELAPADSDLHTAEHLGRRVARTALQFSYGRLVEQAAGAASGDALAAPSDGTFGVTV